MIQTISELLALDYGNFSLGILGFKVSTTTYLQDYVLGQLDSPLVITIDEVNRLFNFPEVAQ